MTDYVMEDWAGEVGDRWLAHVDTFESMIAPAGEAAIAAANFRSGQSVADIGCGGGATSFAIADIVGPDGRVLGVDIAPQLVACASRRAEDRGVKNASFTAMDAEFGAPEAAPFDRLFSRFGVMFFQDTARAFANMRAWLKPGGDFVFACWAPPQDNPWMAQAAAIISDYAELPERAPDGPGPFRLADPDAVRAMLHTAGYGAVGVQPWRGEQHVGGFGATPDRAADFVVNGMGIGEVMDEQAPDRKAEAQARIAEMMAPHYREGTVRMAAATLIVTAHNPG